MPRHKYRPTTDAGPATPPGPDLSRLHPDRLRVGGTGVFAGDWASYDPGHGQPWRIHVGLVGVLVDRWNGWAVFSCTREVAEAIVADQDRMRADERARLAAAGLTGDELATRVDATIPPMYFDGDTIVVDERAGHPDDGDQAVTRIAADDDGLFIVNGWNWCWTAVDPAVCDRIAGQIPAPGQEQQYVELDHTPGLRVPHDRIRVADLQQMPTHNGIAFTAQLHLDGQPVGTIENNGNGGATAYYAVNSSAFTWRHLADYTAASRRNGQPVTVEDILNALVDEYDITREVAQAINKGSTVVRLLDEHTNLLDLLTVTPAPRSLADRTALARRLTADNPHPQGIVWQVWAGTAWHHLGTATTTPAT